MAQKANSYMTVKFSTWPPVEWHMHEHKSIWTLNLVFLIGTAWRVCSCIIYEANVYTTGKHTLQTLKQDHRQNRHPWWWARNKIQIIGTWHCGNIPQSKHTIPTPSVDVGTSHSPTHNPYSFGRTAPNLTPSVDQLLFLLLQPDNSYSQIHTAKMRYLYTTAHDAPTSSGRGAQV
jgi:hypothetical protein